MRLSMSAAAASGLVMCLMATPALAERAPRTPTVQAAGLPYRFVIAHRGAGAYLAPENTAAAFERGIADPASDLLEFDVQTLKDGAGGIWHDSTVDRISTSSGPVSSYGSAAFKRLTIDAGNWFGGGAKNARPLLLAELLDRFGGRKRLLAHPKNATAAWLVVAGVKARGLERSVEVQTGSIPDAVMALRAGLVSQVLIGNAAEAGTRTPAQIKRAGITRVSLNSALPDSLIASYVRAGLIVTCYDVNRHYRRDRLFGIGVRGIDSDDPAYIRGDVGRYHRADDPFRLQTWWYGHMGDRQSASALGPAQRGAFTGHGWWTIPRGTAPLFVRQGWASPLRKAFTLQAWLRFDALSADRTRWAGIYFSARFDHAFNDAANRLNAGYTLILRQNGRLQLYRKDPNRTVLLRTVKTSAVRRGSVAKIKIVVDRSSVRFRRYDVAARDAVVRDGRYRGAHLFVGRAAHAGHEGPRISVSNIKIS